MDRESDSSYDETEIEEIDEEPQGGDVEETEVAIVAEPVLRLPKERIVPMPPSSSWEEDIKPLNRLPDMKVCIPSFASVLIL
jgi:hypothetical protein